MGSRLPWCRMRKKGVTKFWIEIIGGVIIVVIILVIVLYAGSKIASLIEDAAAANAYDGFTQTLVKAYTTGEHVISPWKLSDSRSNHAYGIVYMTQNLASYMKANVNLVSGSEYNLQSCETDDMNDACLCMLSINYVTYSDVNCGDMPFTVVAVESSANYKTEMENIESWNEDFPIKPGTNTVSEINVLRCASMESFCSWVDPNGVTKPCTIHYNSKPVVWLGTGDHILDFEELRMKKTEGSFHVDISYKWQKGIWAQDNMCATLNCKPCYDCGACGVYEIGDWSCGYTGSKCLADTHDSGW